MLSEKIYKPIETQEQCDNYSAIAEWCNENNCTIEDKGDYYEVVEVVPKELPIDDTPTVQDLVEALDILSSIVLGGAE